MLKRYRLSNGIEVVAERLPHFRSATLGIWTRVGSVNETKEINGVSHLLEHLFFKGTKTRTARQIMESLEGSGGSANAFTSREYTTLYSKILDTHIDLAAEILADVLLNSTFRDIDKEKAVVAEEIQSYVDTPEEHVMDLLSAVMWRRHALGFPITGSKKALERLNLQVVKNYYKNWYVPSNILIAAAGNFDCEAIKDLFEKHFGRLTGGNNRRDYLPPKVRAQKKLFYRKIGQVHLSIGLPGVSAGDHRRYPLNLLVNILGGSPISRLYQRVREDEGLAYQVNSFVSSYEKTGMVGIYAALSPRHAQRAADIIFEEMASLRKRKVPEDELQSTKEQLKGSVVLALESTSGRMTRLARSILALDRIESLDTIMRKIDEVTAEDILELANELFQNKSLNLVTLGPIKKLAVREL